MALNGTSASYHPFVEARPLARPDADASPTSQLPLRILYVEHQPDTDLAFIRRYGPSVHIRPVATGDEALRALREYYPADAVVVSQEAGGLGLLEQIRRIPWLRDMPVLLLVPHVTAVLQDELRRWPDTDLFPSDFSRGDLLARLTYFARRRQFSSRRSAESGSLSVRVPWWKRSFDVAVSGTALLLLSPVLAAVALAIRFDSPGPVIYRSKRVGAGYRIFDLYKFRSMRTGADAQVKQMGALNLYNRADEVPSASLCDTCRAAGSACRQPLFLDGEQVCERLYSKQARSKAAFMKFQNDPRVTRLGAFLRNSSLDELPQLVNIFLGDMSLVGNRPLPLYEAEKLTSDDYIQRFAGPAGLTGLWQVTKRGKGREDMSEEERMQLDIEYARNFSFGMDLKIILKTFPALIQSANV